MAISRRLPRNAPWEQPMFDIISRSQQRDSRIWADHKIGITGRFGRHTQAEIEAAMHRHGAVTVDKPYQHIHYLIWDGVTYSRKLRLAIQFGTIIVDHNWLLTEAKKLTPAPLPMTQNPTARAMAQRAVNRNDARFQLEPMT